MHSLDHLGPRIILGLFDGKLLITESILFAMGVSVVMIIVALLSARKLEKYPKGAQFWAELIVTGIYNMVGGVMGEKNKASFGPYIGTLFIFLILCNSTGLWGIRPVTADINITLGLATMTFFLIQGSTIKFHGVKGWLKHYADPYPFMVPIKIIENVSLPLSMAFRLFGNIAGGMIIMALVVMALTGLSESLGLTIPFFLLVIPLPANAFFDMFEPVLQAFIFTMLTMAFTGMNIATHEDH